MNYLFYSLFLLTSFCLTLSAQKLPQAPNVLNADSTKQGKWIFYFSEEMEETIIEDSISYYRIAEYDNDAPQDTIRDYYKTGELYRKANMILLKGREVEDGIVTWYHKNGEKSKEVSYTQGEDGKLNKWDKNGEPVLDFEYYFAMSIAEYYNKNGRNYNKSINYGEQALEKAEIEFGVHHKNYGEALNNLAILYKEIGKYGKALKYNLEAVESVGNNLGKEHPSYLVASVNLAKLYFSMGNYEAAFPIFKESLITIENDLETYNFAHTIVLNDFARLLVDMGAYNNALPLYKKAIELNKSREHYEYGINLMNLATLYELMDNYDAAAELYPKASENLGNYLGKQHFYYGVFLNNNADFHKSIKNYDKALSTYVLAQENIENSVGKKHLLYATCLFGLAKLHQETNNFEKAFPLYSKGIEIVEEILGEQHPEYSEFLQRISSFYKSSENYNDGIAYLTQSNQIRRNNLLQILSFTSKKGQQSYLKTQSDFLDFTASYQHQSPNNYSELNEILYDNELLWKGLLLSNQQQFSEQIKASKDTTLTNQYTEWQSINEIIGYQSTLSLKRRIYDVDSLQKLSDKMEENLALRSAEFSNLRKTQTATWKDIQQKLKSNEIAIEFIDFENQHENNEENEQLYAAIVLRSSGSPQYIPLCKETDLLRQLNQQKQQLNEQITAIYASRGISNEEEDAKPLFTGTDKSLHELLWQPLDSMLTNVNTIYYAPSGLLHKVNLAAITNESDNVLAEKYNFHLLGSTRQLLNYKTNKAQKENLLLYGNIAFGENSQLEKSIAVKDTNSISIDHDPYAEAVRSMSLNLKELPGTQQEVKAIANLAKRKHNYILKEQNEATESNFKTLSETTKPSVLHIATHGFFYQQLGQDTLESYPYFMVLENALMRSGLALSGANTAIDQKNHKNVNDGILTAYEIANLNLQHVDLAVLSACETATGDIEGTEGVYGLQRAFKLAGVDKLIMSLWKVDDKATQEFMTQFYTNWLKKKKTAYESFTTAQSYMRNKYKNPYYWAAFLLME